MNNKKPTSKREMITFPCRPHMVATILKKFGENGWKVKTISPVNSNLTEIVFYK